MLPESICWDFPLKTISGFALAANAESFINYERDGIVAPVALFPFGGMKDSFFGVLHTQGKEAVRFFTESKIVIQRWF